MEYYSNPKIPEGINVTEPNQLKSFARSCLKLIGFIAALLIAADLGARLMAPFIPFEWERSFSADSFLTAEPNNQQEMNVENELKSLGKRLTEVMELPDGMTITIHYNSGPTVNAFATLGGHIVVYQGLLDIMPTEESLAAVLAHEIGHIKHRDMIKGFIRVISAGVVLSATGSDLGSDLANVGFMSYSRGQEKAADKAASKALGKLYGHTGGLEECFRALMAHSTSDNQPEFLSSHPNNLKRIAASKKMAAQMGWPSSGSKTPLHPIFKSPPSETGKATPKETNEAAPNFQPKKGRPF